jgi:hypothetical protein
VERIADEDGLGHDELVITQVRDERAHRRLRHRDPDHQAERKCAIDEDLPELARARGLGIEVERLRVMRHR